MKTYPTMPVTVWAWPPFKNIVRDHRDVDGHLAQLIWIALYVLIQDGGGVFKGDTLALAQHTNYRLQDVERYVARLIELCLVDYDGKGKMMRLTVLPEVAA